MSSTKRITWTGPEITELCVYRNAPLLLRYDVLPFAALYFYLLYVFLTGGISRFSCLILFFMSLAAHILALLLQYWSLRVKIWVSLNSVNVLSGDEMNKGPLFVFVVPRMHRGKPELISLNSAESGVYFSFQKAKYIFDNDTQTFNHASFPIDLPLAEYTSTSQTALKKWGSVAERRFLYGPNSLNMPVPSFWDLYKDHLLAPFFVFQVFSILLWIVEDQWQYSAVTLCMMLVFEATVCQARLRSLRELRGLRNKPRNYFVLRERKWVSIKSSEILPGDVVSVDRGRDDSDVVPCDFILLGSNAVVDEAMLTGESIPTLKESIGSLSTDSTGEKLAMGTKHKNHVLFGGTRVLKIDDNNEEDCVKSMNTPDGGALCLALRTGFATSQGELLKTILYSTETVTANSWEAACFILFLLFNAIIASGYVLYHRYSEDADVRYKLLLRCILIVTSVVPPELPMQLSLAVNSSLIALAQSEVFCTEPFRIPYAGKIDVCCFDKTGTLTSDDFRVIGVASPPETENSGEKEVKSEIALKSATDTSFDAQLVLAACHSLVHIDGRLIGDSLELAALEAVEWNFGRTETCFPKRRGASSLACRIIRRFRFSSELQRMSAIVALSGGSTGNRILTKGSPEAIHSLLDSVPEGYEKTAKSLARRGMRVLALAFKNLDDISTLSELNKLPRSEGEMGLTFVGFVCFESPLRLDSRKVVRKLKRSSHQVSMITGDSTLTAAHVAVQVGMVSKPVLILEVSAIDKGYLEWVSASTGEKKKGFDVRKVAKLSTNFDLCISGTTLGQKIFSSDEMMAILKYFTVFARVTPAQKEMILNTLNASGLRTLMCGDGTNDVGALKQAHVGVALLSTTNMHAEVDGRGASRGDTSRPETRTGTENRSQVRSRKKGKSSKRQSKESLTVNNSTGSQTNSGSTKTNESLESTLDAIWESEMDQAPLVKLGDASIAAPFTSRRLTVDSCVSIIRQGRCTLATTLQMYQILALNGLIQAFSLSVLYLEGVSFGERQMTITGVCLAFAFFMISRSKSLKKLSEERPPSSVFSPVLFLSLLAQCSVHVAVLWVSVQFAKQFETIEVAADAKFEPSVFNTVVFMVSVMQQVAVMIVNYKGRPFMEGLSDNRGLRYSLISVSAIVLCCTLELVPELNQLMQCAPWPSFDLQLKVIGLLGLDLGLSWFLDFLVRTITSVRWSKKVAP